MNKVRLVISMLLALLFFFSCEEDDVCVGEGTPYLTVVFRNNLNNANLSDSLTIYSSDNAEFTNETLLYEKVFTDSLKLPLGGLDTSQTFFRIQRRSNIDADTLTVNYDPISEFVSKACGFRITYSAMAYATTYYHINYLEASDSNVIQNEVDTNLYIILSD